ncbi:MAG: sigma 54-interacting transcriptional regulator [Blastocatellia bacterium]|nr:sigma 54-interacting transcriptional regulator [Blastocatellia bacterium]
MNFESTHPVKPIQTWIMNPAGSEYPLRQLIEGTAATTGTDFFRALVKHLALSLSVGSVFVSEFSNHDTTVQTLAYWANQDFQPNLEFDVKGTPCEDVGQGTYRHIPERAAHLYPADAELVRWQAQGYLAVPMMAEDGRVLGHLVAFDERPIFHESHILSIFHVFVERARVELERIRMEQALRDSELRLSRILGSTMDAILTVDESLRITLFNEAAEKVFRITSREALGKPLPLFLSDGLSRFFMEYAAALSQDPQARQSIWLPEGLSALRADGQAFFIEGSISYVKVASQGFYTVILHDIDERQKTEAEIRKLQQENRYLQEELKAEYNFEEIIGTTPVMHKVFQKVKQVALVDSSVLIIGETGTGKELIARAIHNRSKRQNRPLIKVNCAALSHGLIESEFFGHEKGAFTGAITQRIGRFELAHGGTIFLDEIGEISLEVQAKLLRVLQEQEFERVGGSKTIPVDVRVIAATNRDLKKAVEEGRFRADLYYRLNVFPIDLPPLRDRREDISLLVRYFVSKHMTRIGKRITHITPTAIDRLTAYGWPGNIRELENVVERAVVLTDGPVFEIDEEGAGLPGSGGCFDSQPFPFTSTPHPLRSLEEIERDHIVQVLEQVNWVIDGAKGAAAILDLKPNTLRSRLQKLNLRRPTKSHS